jgi:hypothetical protein
MSLCVAHRHLHTDGVRVHALAGAVASVSMLAYPNTSIAMYTLWKLIECMYANGRRAGYIPHVPGGAALLYAVSTAFCLMRVRVRVLYTVSTLGCSGLCRSAFHASVIFQLSASTHWLQVCACSQSRRTRADWIYCNVVYSTNTAGMRRPCCTTPHSIQNSIRYTQPGIQHFSPNDCSMHSCC